MKCSLCEHDNLPGAEDCERCGGDLRSASYEAASGRGRLQKAVLGNVGDVGVLDAIRMQPTATVKAAVDAMREQRHGSVMIMDDDRLVGIFTERDLISRVGSDQDLSALQLVDVMTKEPRTYRLSQSLAHAMNAQALRGHRHLAVVDDEESLVGFVSVRGILSHIRAKTGL